MKIAFLATCLATNVATAATPIDGWYGTLFGGYTYLPNNINNTRSGLTHTDARYNAGFNAGGSIGYKSNPMRYEGELTYLSAKVNRFKINDIPQTNLAGYSNAISAMANVYYDLPQILIAIQPYLGVGIGYAWVKANLKSTNSLIETRFIGSNTVFAYQAMGGLTYHFDENDSAYLGYRYLATQRADHLGKNFQAHLASVGVTFRFDEHRYQ